jgi:hypothetical protein
MMSDFQREDRYLVIKYSDMEKLPNDVRRNFSGRCRSFYEQMLIAGAPARSFLVIESDWPEYDPAWQMIERRMTGQPTVTAAEELDSVLHWRNKHTQAIKERDALQLRLNAADQRIDDFAGGECEWRREDDSGIWNSGCGETWSFHEDGPEENGMHFCHSCGKHLVVEVTEQEQDDDWHMNPCKQGHRDVGAAGGIAHCYTCDEKIEAATTQEAFERWNASHPQQ